MQAFTRVLLLSLVVLFTHGAASYAADSGNSTNGGIPGIPSSIEWNNAPLACMPDRAEKWKTPSTNEPCHCPPADFCPKFDSIKPEDINFYISVTYLTPGMGTARHYMTLSGDDVPYLKENPTKIFELTNAQLKNHVEPVAQRESPLIARDYRQNWVDHGPGPARIYFTHTSGNMINYTLETAIGPKSNIMDWVDDNLKMPVGLTLQCCDRICPERTVPKQKKVTIVQIPQKIKEKRETITNEDGEEEEVITEEIIDLEPETIEFQTITCERADITELREGCIKEGTPIITADGKSKKIEELKVGDVLKGQKGDVTVLAINKFAQDTDEMYGFNGGEAFITAEHPVLTIAGWKSINPEITSVKSDMGVVGKLDVGDKIITKDGIVEINTIEKHIIKDNATAYNLSVQDGDGFIANDVVVKGFNHVQIHY